MQVTKFVHYDYANVTLKKSMLDHGLWLNDRLSTSNFTTKSNDIDFKTDLQ